MIPTVIPAGALAIALSPFSTHQPPLGGSQSLNSVRQKRSMVTVHTPKIQKSNKKAHHTGVSTEIVGLFACLSSLLSALWPGGTKPFPTFLVDPFLGPFPAWLCRSFPRTHGRTTPLRKLPNKQETGKNAGAPLHTSAHQPTCAFPHYGRTTTYDAHCLLPLLGCSAADLLRSTSSFDRLSPSFSSSLFLFFSLFILLPHSHHLTPFPTTTRAHCWRSAPKSDHPPKPRDYRFSAFFVPSPALADPLLHLGGQSATAIDFLFLFLSYSLVFFSPRRHSFDILPTFFLRLSTHIHHGDQESPPEDQLRYACLCARQPPDGLNGAAIPSPASLTIRSPRRCSVPRPPSRCQWPRCR